MDQTPNETNQNVSQSSKMERRNKCGVAKQQDFLDDFDPVRSEREKRKLNRKLNAAGKTNLYDDKGLYLQTGEDICDCLDKSCEGCHFPCSKCSSRKCGHECRCKRKWVYDSIADEGCDNIIKNPLRNQRSA